MREVSNRLFFSRACVERTTKRRAAVARGTVREVILRITYTHVCLIMTHTYAHNLARTLKVVLPSPAAFVREMR
jgi:hypothetical protein